MSQSGTPVSPSQHDRVRRAWSPVSPLVVVVTQESCSFPGPWRRLARGRAWSASLARAQRLFLGVEAVQEMSAEAAAPPWNLILADASSFGNVLCCVRCAKNALHSQKAVVFKGFIPI